MKTIAEMETRRAIDGGVPAYEYPHLMAAIERALRARDRQWRKAARRIIAEAEQNRDEPQHLPPDSSAGVLRFTRYQGERDGAAAVVRAMRGRR